MQKLFAHLDFHCNPNSDPCARKKDRPFSRCTNCRVYVFADRFMGPTFQKETLGGLNENPYVLVLDSVGCQYDCWFCYARDILDTKDPVSPHSGWKTNKFMTPREIALATECKLSVKHSKMKKTRPFARFRITGGEPLFATKSTIKNFEAETPINASVIFWFETFRALNTIFRQLRETKRIRILTHKEFVEQGRPLHTQVSTWLTQSPGKIEIRFDTNCQLFSSKAKYTEDFVKGVFKLHKNRELDAIRINIDYSVKGPTPIEFEWSQSRSLPVDVAQIKKPFDIKDHPQYAGIKNLNLWLDKAYSSDRSFKESLRLDIERGINFTDTSKYGTRKLGVLYDTHALDWNTFARKAQITFSEVNNPIQLQGQAKRSKYIKDHLKRGAEVLIVDPVKSKELIKFDPFPDDQKEHEEYERKIREDLEKANKLISDGVKRAKNTGRFDIQIIIRPTKKIVRHVSKQKKLELANFH